MECGDVQDQETEWSGEMHGLRVTDAKFQRFCLLGELLVLSAII